MMRYTKNVAVKRHRVTKNSPTPRTTRYFVKNYRRTLTPVCIRTFTEVLQISQYRINRLTRKEFANVSIDEQRGGFRMEDRFVEKRRSIKEFISSLVSVESHYCRGKTQKHYLAPELNITKLHRMYIAQVESEELKSVKLSYFRFIFNTKFNYGFGSPRSDVCSTCLSFQEQIKAEKGN